MTAKRRPMKNSISGAAASWHSNHASPSLPSLLKRLILLHSTLSSSSKLTERKKKPSLLLVEATEQKMGIPSEMRDVWIQRRIDSFLIPSPAEDEKKLRAARFSQGFYLSFP